MSRKENSVWKSDLFSEDKKNRQFYLVQLARLYSQISTPANVQKSGVTSKKDNV